MKTFLKILGWIGTALGLTLCSLTVIALIGGTILAFNDSLTMGLLALACVGFAAYQLREPY